MRRIRQTGIAERRPRLRFSGLVVSCLLLAGCAARDPLDGFAFVPPAGWTALPPHEGSRLWTNPRNAGEEILVTRPSDLQPGGVQNAEGKPVKICGGHAATLTIRTGNVYGRAAHLEAVTSTWQGMRIMAAYVRPLSSRADPRAEAAIRTLCAAP